MLDIWKWDSTRVIDMSFDIHVVLLTSRFSFSFGCWLFFILLYLSSLSTEVVVVGREMLKNRPRLRELSSIYMCVEEEMHHSGWHGWGISLSLRMDRRYFFSSSLLFLLCNKYIRQNTGSHLSQVANRSSSKETMFQPVYATTSFACFTIIKWKSNVIWQQCRVSTGGELNPSDMRAKRKKSRILRCWLRRCLINHKTSLLKRTLCTHGPS